ncbi:AraC family transcriptional regulator, partial [Prevotellamassilia timonensis]|uniref:helix-turn-helix domain-containing protein n=2 Tax=Prevotellamassilia timonensis TaxID=1852370 RepID=UPI003078CE23
KSVIRISLCRTAKRNPLMRVRDKDCVKSKKLLAENESIIKEISEELAVADAPHFVKFFKKETGMTPSQFKETLKFCLFPTAHSVIVLHQKVQDYDRFQLLTHNRRERPARLSCRSSVHH